VTAALQQAEVPAAPETEYFYRYEERRWSLGADEFDNPYPGYRLTVELEEYQVVKKTPKGVWLSRTWKGNPELGIRPYLSDGRRFVRLGTRKQFAYPTYVPQGEKMKHLKSSKHPKCYYLRAGL